jgi:hypothetical protein
MSYEANVLMVLLDKYEIFRRTNGNGETTIYYYYDETTWVVGALALAWLTWFFIARYMRASALRRRPRRTGYSLLKRIVKIKNELSSRYLRPGFSKNVHAVGVGLLGGDYCIQVFVSDANDELWIGSGAAPLPNNYRGVPLVLVEMAPAGFLSEIGSNTENRDQYSNGIREYQELIIGGISGAHANLTGQSGTIGYLCTRKSKLPGRKDVYLLSNSHVFADLRKTTVDESDLIMQPSPGEAANNRPIGTLASLSAVKFNQSEIEPNQIDAAIARLWGPEQHSALLPMIGAVKGYVAKRDVQVGEAARKFGRTTGYTEGRVFSIYLDIWIRYDRTGQSAFFQNQLLIEPALPDCQKFVAKGDSGSLVVDVHHHAIGLIFAGRSDAPGSTPPPAQDESNQPNPAARPPRIEGYGVANSISEVLERLKIELLV